MVTKGYRQKIALKLNTKKLNKEETPVSCFVSQTRSLPVHVKVNPSSFYKISSQFGKLSLNRDIFPEITYVERKLHLKHQASKKQLRRVSHAQGNQTIKHVQKSFHDMHDFTKVNFAKKRTDSKTRIISATVRW